MEKKAAEEGKIKLRLVDKGFLKNSLIGEFEFDVTLEGGVSQKARIKIESIDINNPKVNCGDEGTEGKSLWGIFLLGLE